MAWAYVVLGWPWFALAIYWQLSGLVMVWPWAWLDIDWPLAGNCLTDRGIMWPLPGEWLGLRSAGYLLTMSLTGLWFSMGWPWGELAISWPSYGHAMGWASHDLDMGWAAHVLGSP
jgi:hypothetical protein